MRLTLCAALAVAATVVNAASPTATTKMGTYAGEHLPTFNQDMFIGIRYAQVPTGDLRFAPTQPLNESWTGQKSAVDYGNSCYAFGVFTDNDNLPQSEDCLTLNIVRPSGYEGKKLPVGVWIHGGGFVQGVSFRDLYNLSYPVQQSVEGGTPIIGVSINYRLGPFGFLASEEVQKDGSLNNGLKDQVEALNWIKQNIEAFNGDSSKITIWGESAGGESVAMLMLGYGGKLNNLFHQGIMESGSATTQQYYPINYWQPQYENITKLTGCNKQADTLNCLRQLDINKLVPIINITNGHISKTYSPTVDGDFIPDWPKNLLRDGRYVKIPVISGANTDEGTSFGPGNVNTTKQISDWLSTTYTGLKSSTIQEILKLYPNVPAEGCPYGTGDLYSGPPYGDQYKRGSAIGGDIVMVGTRRMTCEVLTRAGMKVYSYNFNQSDYGTAPAAGATHFQEVVYVFDNPSPTFPQSYAAPMGPDPTGSKKRLGDLMSRFFMSFIATGDPNNAKLNGSYAKWPVYNLNHPQNYYFSANGSQPEDDTFRKEAINYLSYAVGHQFLT